MNIGELISGGSDNAFVRFDTVVNGFPLSARFSKVSIDEIFLPLLRTWTASQRSLGRRMTVFLAAPPGCGKSTLSLFLEHLSRSAAGLTPIQAVGIDGYHHKRQYLLTHYTDTAEGRRPLNDYKGSPDTFDVSGLLRQLACVREHDVIWPVYDRSIHDTVDAGSEIASDILLVEGNYLLLDYGDWKKARGYCDSSVFIRADADMLRRRLIDRKMRGGTDKQEAELHYMRTDGPNVQRVLSCSQKADIELRMTGDGEFSY